MGAVLHVYSGCEGWAIIFCETKNNVTEMEMNLQKKTNTTFSFYMTLSHSQQESTMESFKECS